MIRAFLLGLRLSAAGGRTGWLRLGLMASGGAVAAFVVLTTLGVNEIAGRQEQREQRIAPLIDTVTMATHAPGALTGERIGDGWDGRELRRIVLATDDVTAAAAPVPPGLSRLPRPDEVMSSPALAELIEHEPLVAARFPQEHGEVIDDDGLVAPDQLLAYVGVERDELGPLAVEFAGFGDPKVEARLDPRAARTIGLLLLLTMVAPVCMFMAACARLSATARGQRLAALRLLGLSARRAQLVNAAETGMVAVAGSVIGLVAWLAWRRLQPSVQVGSFGWFSSDLHLAPGRIVGGLVGLIGLSVLTAALGSLPSIVRPLRVRRERSVRSVSAWRAMPLVVGVTLLAISRATADGTSADFVTWMLPFGMGLGLTAAGLVLVMPLVAIALGRWWSRSDRPAVLLASNRLRHEPAVAGRVTAALAVALFAAGVAQVVAVSVDRYDDENLWSIPTIVNVEVIGAATQASTYAPLSDVGIVLPVWRPGAGDDVVDAVVATCAQLRLATDLPLETCDDGHVHRVTSTRELAAPADPDRDQRTDAAMVGAGLPPVSGQLAFDLPFVNGFFTPAVVVPPPLAPPEAERFYVAMTAAAYDPQQLTAALSGIAPAAMLNPWITYIDRLDTPRIYRGLIAVGTVAALIIGLAALVAATVDRAIERRRATAHLVALGASTQTLRTAIVLQVLPISLILLTTSTAGAILGGSSYLQWGSPDSGVPVAALARISSLSIFAAVAATVAAVVAVVTPQSPQVLRQE